MAVVRDKAAVCSSNCYYDIFLSFRGKNTRKSFTDHLYTTLIRQGFLTFRDDDEVEKGENLKEELEKAIRQSKSSILVLSKDYASSPWCLDELAMILEKRRMSEINHLKDREHRKHEVLPVFYNVKPSHLRKQKGTIGKEFIGYEKQIEAEKDPETKRNLIEKVKRWRSALTEVAGLIGLELENYDSGREAKFIDKIIAVIGDKLRRATLHVSRYEIGIESRAQSINKWLQDKTTDVSVIAICGMGGIGKTTIAKFVYNQNARNFDGSSFLADIREVSRQPNGLVFLQTQLLSDISRRETGKIYNVHEGLAKIKNILCSKRVLLVLDDVDQVDQTHEIYGMQDWLFPRSKIIITTRDEKLVKSHQIRRVKKLGEDESIKLFSLHAFGEDRPLENYIEHTKRAVRVCEGLPLALKVIGSSLLGKSEDEWVSELEKLEAIPHNKILTKLKTSFDSLQDDYDRRLFLHIACFFVGTDKYQATIILEKCDLHAKVGIQNLIDRCLLEKDSHVVLKMHKLIQVMGREIIHQEAQQPEGRSRLWHHQDAFNVLKYETGTKSVEGLTLDMRKVDESRNIGKKRRYEEFCDSSTFSKYVNSFKARLNLIYRHSLSTTLTTQDAIYLRTDAFKSMTNLTLLELNYVKLIGNYDDFPKGLVWLSWHGFPLDIVPCELSLDKLVTLDLRHSRLKQAWKKTPFLESLKILDMSYSERLERTPNFVGLPNLARLILKGCLSLVEVCESIGNLVMLELLNLSDCKSLRKLPGNIRKLESLSVLDISGCNITEFPCEMSDMKLLKKVKQIVWSIVLTPREGSETLWSSLPCSLNSLDLSNCNLSEDSFPRNFGNLPSLKYMDLSNNLFRRLPNCIKSLSGILSLRINHCDMLQSLDLDGFERKLTYLQVYHCSSLEKITSLDHVPTVYLGISGCSKLDEVEGRFKSKLPTELFGLEMENSSSPHSVNQVVMLEFGIVNFHQMLGVWSGEIPWNSIDGKSEGSSITFTVPILLVTHTFIKCLNVFCTFERKDDVVASEEFGISHFFGNIYVKIKNNTKDLTWIYVPWIYYGNYDNRIHEDHWEWWSKWRFGNQLEAGDEITITFHTEFDLRNEVYEVKECGFKIEYQQEEENGEGSTTIHKSHHDFPEFRLTTGEYLLFLPFKLRRDEAYWLSTVKQWCEDLIREDVEEVEFEEDSNDKTPHQS